jgi:acetolactate synthase-1/2/3 large subunit
MDERTKVKVSDAIADFLAIRGVSHVFGVTGGASIHLLHSLRAHQATKPIFVHHEQAAAMAADGYARVTENFGVAVATSGPGATNLITGIAGAWFDSIPCLFLSGQVARYRLRGGIRTRQYGFQETDIVQMVEGITKFAVQVSDPDAVIPVLESALEHMGEGRPGPVLVDIPDDVQRAVITKPVIIARVSQPLRSGSALGREAKRVLSILQESRRPTLVLGAGMASTTRGRRAAESLIEQLRIPTLTTWRAKDLLEANSPSYVGTFGSHGTRAGNFVIQNSDFTLVLGSRLSTRETGTPMSLWARESKVVVVDVDPGELEKFKPLGRPIALGVVGDCRDFAEELVRTAGFVGPDSRPSVWSNWFSYVERIKADYDPVKVGERPRIEGFVDPYRFIAALAQEVPTGEHIFLDTGCTVAWTMQAFSPQRGIRLHHDCNNTAMGWALPAAIGGALAVPSRQATCLVGDGSIMMNLQEVSSLLAANCDVVTILINNFGYAMVRQTEDQWLGSVHVGTDTESGDLSFPNFSTLASAFGLPYLRIDSERSMGELLRRAFTHRRCLVEVMVSPAARVVPQARFGFPIEDGEPMLDRREFKRNMLVQPYKPS